MHPMLINMNEAIMQPMHTLLYLRYRIRERTIRRGDFFLEEGAPGNEFICIKKGSLHWYMINEGVEFFNLHLREGELFYYPDIPVNGFIQASEDTIIYYIDKADLEHLATASSHFGTTIYLFYSHQRKLYPEYPDKVMQKAIDERWYWLRQHKPGLCKTLKPEDHLYALAVYMGDPTKKKSARKTIRN